MWATKPMDEILFLHVVRANIPHAPPLLQLFCLIFLYSFLNPAFCELRNPYPGIILFSLFLAILHIKKRYFSKVQSAFPQGIIYPLEQTQSIPHYPPSSKINPLMDPSPANFLLILESTFESSSRGTLTLPLRSFTEGLSRILTQIG